MKANFIFLYVFLHNKLHVVGMQVVMCAFILWVVSDGILKRGFSHVDFGLDRMSLVGSLDMHLRY